MTRRYRVPVLTRSFTGSTRLHVSLLKIAILDLLRHQNTSFEHVFSAMPFPTEMKFVRRTEARLGVLLPLSYVNAMCRQNGGELFIAEEDWQLHPIFDDSDRTRLKRTCNDVGRESNQARSCSGFPANGVCIASNGCGDSLIFVPDVKDPSRLSEVIFCWHHENGDIEAVASSFPPR